MSNPQYPVYIPSKGRWESRLTVKALERINVPYKIVVEKEELANYAEVINPDNILVLPFSNQGLIAARNWIKAHSIALGFARHWQLDDNISAFVRLNRNKKIRVGSGTIFRASEDFVDRYRNIAFSGFNYDFFAKARQRIPPFYLNTRIYSCTLVNNEYPYCWRSIYNDDTDVCLQALKDGLCTVLFNAFLCSKAATMTIKGGNTESLYLIPDGRLKMAEALQELHPDVCTVSQKFGRWQHHVNYKPFACNQLIKVDKGEFFASEGVDNYGMELVTI